MQANDIYIDNVNCRKYGKYLNMVCSLGRADKYNQTMPKFLC